MGASKIKKHVDPLSTLSRKRCRLADASDRLARYGFELSQARDLISTVGARTEIFLKTAVLPNSPPKQDFDGCINALKQLGVSRSDRDSLHELRKIYNDSKHDPSYVPSVLELQVVIPQVAEVFQRFSETNRGLLNDEIPIRHHQVFWLAVWDHFIGGDSEVHVIAPARGGCAFAIEAAVVLGSNAAAAGSTPGFKWPLTQA